MVVVENDRIVVEAVEVVVVVVAVAVALAVVVCGWWWSGGGCGGGDGILGRCHLYSPLASTTDTLTIFSSVLFCTKEGDNAKM